MNNDYIVVDTETTGLPKKYGAKFANYNHISSYNSARLVQLCWARYDKDHNMVFIKNKYILPDNFNITNSNIHGITQEIALEKGIKIDIVLKEFSSDVQDVKYIVCHNIDFDYNIIKSELYRLCHNQTICNSILGVQHDICTLKAAFEMKKNKILKKADLGSVYNYFFKEAITGAHDANYDVINTGRIFKEMLNGGYIKV